MFICYYKESQPGLSRQTSEEEHQLPAHKHFFLVASTAVPAEKPERGGTKSPPCTRPLCVSNVVTQRFQRRLIGSSRGGVGQVFSPRLRGSGSIKPQLVFCQGPRTDVQQNQLSGQREAMANTFKRRGSNPIKISGVQRSVPIAKVIPRDPSLNISPWLCLISQIHLVVITAVFMIRSEYINIDMRPPPWL